MKRFFTIMLLLFSWSIVSWADSPLTSTEFAFAYSSSPMVKMAKNVKGDIPSELLAFLANSKAPIDERLAVVNQLGWDIEGTSYGSQLGDYFYEKYSVDNDVDLAEKLDAGTLAVYAYASAMSNYLYVDFASSLGHKAVEKNEGKSFSVAMISALIDAQINLLHVPFKGFVFDDRKPSMQSWSTSTCIRIIKPMWGFCGGVLL